MAYVDGFVIAVPKDKLDAYKAMARMCDRSGRSMAPPDYVECVGDDTPYGEVTSFPRAVQAKDDEVVIFSWIVYEIRAARDAANKKVMEDPRLKKFMEGNALRRQAHDLWRVHAVPGTLSEAASAIRFSSASSFASSYSSKVKLSCA